MAISSLQTGKTPGPDGFPVEFYKAYADELAFRFHTMLVNSLREGTLPLTMSEAKIVVVPKPAKDMEQCASFCPIFHY